MLIFAISFPPTAYNRFLYHPLTSLCSVSKGVCIVLVCSRSLCVLQCACFSSTPSFSGMWLQPSRYCVGYSTLPRREVGIWHGLGCVPMHAVWSCKLATWTTTTCKPITASLSAISIMIRGERSEMSQWIFLAFIQATAMISLWRLRRRAWENSF